MSEILGTGIASASGSIIGWALINWWRRRRDRTKRCGVVLPLGKSYAEHNLVEDETTVYLDIDGAISVQPIRDINKSRLRLELYPLAKEYHDKMVKQFKDKRVVFCSSSFELLKHIGIKTKRIHALMPSKKFMTDNDGKITGVDFKALEIHRLHTEIELPKNIRHYYNSLDELTTKLVRIFKQVK
jgi:hypothetical protein